MNQDLIKELISRLDIVGEKIGISAGYIFPLAVRQVYINAIVSIVATMFVALVTWVLAKRAIHYNVLQNSADVPYKKREEYETMGMALAIASVLCGIFLGIIAICTFIDISRVLNPEYAALKSLLDTIK